MSRITWLSGLFAFVLAGFATVASADDGVLRLERVSERVYAVVGPFGNRSPENLGSNSTSGFVVTDDGVVLVDPGASYQGAARIEAMIKQVTEQPVKIVINSGGQDHRWLGNGYFKERGAQIIASAAAVADHKARTQDQLFLLSNLVGEAGMQGTDPVYAEETFEQEKHFSLGGVDFDLRRVGPAHTPGDSLIWLPQERIVFSGDVVYVGRMLGVIGYSSSSNWLNAFDAMAALEPKAIIPGHGPVTNLAEARKDSRDYLAFLRDAMQAFMDEGGDISEINSVDQSAFDYLIDSDSLQGRNAQRVFEELEWE